MLNTQCTSQLTGDFVCSTTGTLDSTTSTTNNTKIEQYLQTEIIGIAIIIFFLTGWTLYVLSGGKTHVCQPAQ